MLRSVFHERLLQLKQHQQARGGRYLVCQCVWPLTHQCYRTSCSLHHEVFFPWRTGKPHGQILLVILQCWSWDRRRNSSQMGMGSSQALPRSWCKSSQPRLSRVFAKSRPGGLNCYVPIAVMAASGMLCLGWEREGGRDGGPLWETQRR